MIEGVYRPVVSGGFAMPGAVTLLTPEPAAAPELHEFLCHIQTSQCCFLPKNWFAFG